jgi:fibronectin type 3 domain-containing protein
MLLAPSLFTQAAVTNRPNVIAGGGGEQKYLLTTNLSVLAQTIGGEKSGAGTLVNYGGFLGMFDGGLLAPTNLFATTNIDNLIRVSWYRVTGARNYEVRRNNSNDFNSAASLSSNVVSTNYNDSTAGHDTNYFYWVRAMEEFNFSPFSGVVTGHRQCAPPTNVAASKAAFTNKVAITWNAVTGATHYLFYRNASNDAPSSFSFSDNLLVTNYDDSTAVPGTQYWYFVRAANNVSTSYYSTGANGWRALIPPAGVQASDGAFLDKVRVTWTDNTNATGYAVWRGASADTNTAALIGTSPASLYDDSTAIPGTLYYYWVQATSVWTASGLSAPDSGYRGLSAPAGVQASDGAFLDKVRVTWTDNTNAAGYAVWRGASADTNTAALIGTSPSSLYDDPTAIPGTLYYYWVQATNVLTSSGLSAPDSGYRGLSAPAGVQASDGAFLDKVRVTWTDNTNATGYAVWRGASADTNTAARIGASPASLYDDPTAIPGTLYYYWVQATNVLTSSGLGASDSGYRGLSAPAGVQASDGTFFEKVRVTWTDNTNATGYAVWRGASADTNTAALIGTSPASLYDDPTAILGTLYYYWVQATNVLTASGLGVADSGYRRLSAPADVQASDGDFYDRVRVTWTDNTNATSYQIWWNTVGDKNTATKFITEPTGTTYEDFAAAPGTNYYYWVKSQNSFSTSDFSLPDTGYLQLAAPTGVTATKGVFTHKIRVEWNAVTGTTVYMIQRAPPSLDALYDQTDSPHYDDINAAIGTKYNYTIKAKNWNMTSEASDPDAGWRRAVFADYDGDGKSDPALLNKSSGVFRVYPSAGDYAPVNVNMTYDTTTTTIPYEPVAGDYNGNGKSDPAMYQQASGTNSIGLWHVFLSYSGYAKIITRNFGGTGIKPLSGDYDRDGTNDYVVYKNNQPGWITFSLSSYNYTPDIVVPLTENDWIPVAGDYDGDGYTDPAFYIPASGRFAAYLSAAGWNKTVLLDIGSDYGYFIPVAGDYDGDGVFDPCLYSPRWGLMYALLSSDGQVEPWSFGAPPADCVPVGGDYDGDGITDPMIYGESSGYWVLILSSNTNQAPLAVSGWGGPGWVPVR